MPSKLFIRFQQHIDKEVVHIDKFETLLSVDAKITAADYTTRVVNYFAGIGVKLLPSEVNPPLSEVEKKDIQKLAIDLLLTLDVKNQVKIEKWLNADPNKAELLKYMNSKLPKAAPMPKPAAPTPPPPPYPDLARTMQEMRSIVLTMEADKQQFINLPIDTKANQDKRTLALQKYEQSYLAAAKSLQESEAKYLALKNPWADHTALTDAINQSLDDVKKQRDAVAGYLATAKSTPVPPPLPATPPPSLHPDVITGVKKVEDIISQLIAIQTQIQTLIKGLPTDAGHEVVSGIQNRHNTVDQALKTAQGVLKRLNEPDLSAVVMNASDRNNEIAAQLKKAENGLAPAKAAYTEAEALSKRGSYIRYKHQEAQDLVSKLTVDMQGAATERGDTSKHGSADYMMFGTNKRKDTLAADEKVALLKQAVKNAKEDLARWTTALKAYEIEQAVITMQQPIIDKLTQEYNDLTLPPPAAPQPQAIIKAKKAELDEALALANESKRAIESLMRSFGGVDARDLKGASDFVLERGDNGLGFHSQVVKMNDVQSVLGMTKNATTAPVRVAITTVNAETDSLYYLNTPVLKNEVILTSKTYAPGVQGCFVQTKGNIKDQSTGGAALGPHNDELAIQAAVMFVLNQKKGKPVIIRGADDEQIRRVHATLLWMKYQTKDTLTKICCDVLKGQLPKGTDLDLSKLEITSKCEGPKKGGLITSQRTQDDAFINEFMPSLSTKTTLFDQQKKQLMDLKDEHKTVDEPKSRTTILGMSKGPGQ